MSTPSRQQLLSAMTAHLDKEVRGVWQEEDWEPERVAEELLDIVEEQHVLVQRHHVHPKPSHSAMKDEMVERASGTTTADAIKAEQAEQREKLYPDPSEPGVPGNDDDRYAVEVDTRERVREALNAYRQNIIDEQNEAEGSSELDDLLVSLTQVESAKRVLWMTD